MNAPDWGIWSTRFHTHPESLRSSGGTAKGRTTLNPTAAAHFCPTIFQQFFCPCPDSTDEQVNDYLELYPKSYQSNHCFMDNSCGIPFFGFEERKMSFLSQKYIDVPVFLFQRNCLQFHTMCVFINLECGVLSDLILRFRSWCSFRHTKKRLLKSWYIFLVTFNYLSEPYTPLAISEKQIQEVWDS